MDWLKELLEKATITDGKLDVVALMELVKVEFPKHAVPKKDYNDKVTELKTAAENIKKEYALKEKLTAAGVLDADYIIYKRGGLDKFTFDKDGAPVGVDDVIKPLEGILPLICLRPQSSLRQAGRKADTHRRPGRQMREALQNRLQNP